MISANPMGETREAMKERRARIVRALVDETGIDEALIRKLVLAFYAKIRTDPKLGPIFERVIGADWGPHLDRMCDFWSSVMLMTGRYKGNPMLAHLKLDGIAPAHFERWLALFRETASEICTPAAAGAFAARADYIAKSLQLGMFYRPSPKSAAQ